MRLPTRLATLAAVVLAAPLASPVAAQTVVDQQQPVAVGGFGYLSAWSGQTFQAGASNVAGAGFVLRNYGQATGTASIELWTGVPGIGDSQQLASATGTFDTGAAPGDDAWFDLFWAPVSVTVGQTYWIGVFGAGDNYGTATTWSDASSYAAGGAWYNYSTSAASGYSDFSSYDLAFRTHTSIAPTSTVPEPSTWALLGTGLAGVLLQVRRRRRA